MFGLPFVLHNLWVYLYYWLLSFKFLFAKIQNLKYSDEEKIYWKCFTRGEKLIWEELAWFWTDRVDRDDLTNEKSGSTELLLSSSSSSSKTMSSFGASFFFVSFPLAILFKIQNLLFDFRFLSLSLAFNFFEKHTCVQIYVH